MNKSGREEEGGESLEYSSDMCSSILLFLRHHDILAASRVDNRWFEAASMPATWHTQIDSLARTTYDPITCCSSPGMYFLICRSLTNDAHELQALQEEETFFRHIPHLFGIRSKRYSHQFPILLLLLHSPALLSAKVDTASVRDGFDPIPRCWLLTANCLRWFSASPEPAMVPWMLALYEWGARTSRTGFHKMLLAPASMLLRCDKVPLGERDVLRIFNITKDLQEKYVTNETMSQPSSLQEGLLPEADERTVFSMYMLLLQFHRPLVEAHIRRHVAQSGEWAVKEIAAAKIRYDRQRVAQEIAAAERERCSDLLVRESKKKEQVAFSF